MACREQPAGSGDGQMNLRPVSARKTIQDQIYDQLRDALMAGAFKAREPFTIAALSARFQTSHMPVREALRRLASENALQISPAGTAYVPGITRAEFDDILQARVIIECAAAGLAAPHLGPADLTVLEACIRQHREAGARGDIAAMTAANRDFHFHIYRAAGNAVLMSQIENLWLRSGPYLRLLSDRISDLLRNDVTDHFTLHHVEMAEAVAKGDAAALRHACHADLLSTQSLLYDLFAVDEE